MSKLVERLQKAAQGGTPAIGFRAASLLPQSMVLVAALSVANLDSVGLIAGSADAVVAYVDRGQAEPPRRLAQAAGNLPWGLWTEQATAEGIEQLEKAGGDFLVFEPDTTSAALLREDKVGKVLKMSLSQEDGLLRAVDDLAVDVVLIDISKEDPAPTVSHLLRCQRVASLISKPLLIALKPEVTKDDLQALWEGGVDGVVIELSENDSGARLASLKEAIRALPARTRRARRQGIPLVPRLGQGAAEPPAADPDQEEESDFPE